MCGRQLSSRHALVRHQRVHTGERDYTCQYCAQQFTTSYGLRRHVEKHEKIGDLLLIKTEKLTEEDFTRIGMGVAELLRLDVRMKANEASELSFQFRQPLINEMKPTEPDGNKRKQIHDLPMQETEFNQCSVAPLVKEKKSEELTLSIDEVSNEIKGKLVVPSFDTAVKEKLLSVPILENSISEKESIAYRVDSFEKIPVTEFDDQIEQARQWQTAASLISPSREQQLLSLSFDQMTERQTDLPFINLVPELLTMPSLMKRLPEQLTVKTSVNQTSQKHGDSFLGRTTVRQKLSRQAGASFEYQVRDRKSLHLFINQSRNTFGEQQTNKRQTSPTFEEQIRNRQPTPSITFEDHMRNRQPTHSPTFEEHVQNRQPTRACISFEEQMRTREPTPSFPFEEQIRNRQPTPSIPFEEQMRTRQPTPSIPFEEQMPNRQPTPSISFEEQMRNRQPTPSPTFEEQMRNRQSTPSSINHNRNLLEEQAFGEQTTERQSLFIRQIRHRQIVSPFGDHHSRDIQASPSFGDHIRDIQTAHSFGKRNIERQTTTPSFGNQIRDIPFAPSFNNHSRDNMSSFFFENQINDNPTNVRFGDIRISKESDPSFEHQGRILQPTGIAKDLMWERHSGVESREADKVERLPLDLAAIARSVGINIPEGYS